MPKKVMPRNCLTCKYAREIKEARDIYDDRSSYIACDYPMPDPMPQMWDYTAAHICYWSYDEGSKEVPTIEVCHCEYYNEVTIDNCPRYRRGQNDLDWHRVPQEDGEV